MASISAAAAAASYIGSAVEAAGSYVAANAAAFEAAGTVVAAAGSAYESHVQGVAASNQDKQKARVEALNETQKQIDMRQRMLAALASQNAGTLGAVGTGRGTSFGANAMRQITQSQNDLMVSSANSSAQVSLLDQAASNSQQAGNIGAATDLVGGVAKLGH